MCVSDRMEQRLYGSKPGTEARRPPLPERLHQPGNAGARISPLAGLPGGVPLARRATECFHPLFGASYPNLHDCFKFQVTLLHME